MDKIKYPDHYLFTSEHEWVNIVSDEIVEVGLTELAIREIKVINRLEIFTLGENLQKNQVFGRIISEIDKAKLIMPVSGTVAEVNNAYCDNPGSINEAYVHNNWIIRIHPQLPVNKSGLLTLEQYKEHKINNMLRLIQYLKSLDTN